MSSRLRIRRVCRIEQQLPDGAKLLKRQQETSIEVDNRDRGSGSGMKSIRGNAHIVNIQFCTVSGVKKQTQILIYSYKKNSDKLQRE